RGRRGVCAGGVRRHRGVHHQRRGAAGHVPVGRRAQAQEQGRPPGRLHRQVDGRRQDRRPHADDLPKGLWRHHGARRAQRGPKCQPAGRRSRRV
ncbi:hypothetical protein IWQ56_003192, partial [Coemansia nantahalensis]